MGSRSAWLVVLAGLAACGGNDTPCTMCAAVEGTWALTWTSGGSGSAACPAMGPQPATLEIKRTAASVTADIDGTSLVGTLYTSDTFVLYASDTTRDMSFRGDALAGAADAGMRLRGTLSVQTGGKTPCTTIDSYTGLKR